MKTYRATFKPQDPPFAEKVSDHERHFCSVCGSHLYAFSPSYPELIYPVASSIDTPLPAPPFKTHMMLRYKAPWVVIPKESTEDKLFEEYPQESISEWHITNGLQVE